MNLSPFARLCFAGASSLLLAVVARADVKLPAVISDNMVLMPETPANVWGWAAPQEAVTVKLGAREVKATAAADGKWNVKLEGLTAGPAGDMTVTGKNSLTVKNVAVGEVWVASGQSNMEMVVASSMNAAEEQKSADHPNIRMFTVTKNAQGTPQEDLV